MNMLKPSSGTRLGRGCGLSFGIPWTLIAGVFLVSAAASLIEDPAHNIFPAAPVILVSLVFVAIGLMIISASVIPWIAELRISKPEVAISKNSVRIGDGFSVSYSQTFRQKADVRGIKVSLVKREQATYSSGSSSTTVAHEEPAAEYEYPAKTYEAGEILSFSRGMEIPQNGMHTFRSAHNQIAWLMRVKMDVAGWPDYLEDFEVYVQPSVGR